MRFSRACNRATSCAGRRKTGQKVATGLVGPEEPPTWRSAWQARTRRTQCQAILEVLLTVSPEGAVLRRGIDEAVVAGPQGAWETGRIKRDPASGRRLTNLSGGCPQQSIQLVFAPSIPFKPSIAPCPSRKHSCVHNPFFAGSKGLKARSSQAPVKVFGSQGTRPAASRKALGDVSNRRAFGDITNAGGKGKSGLRIFSDTKGNDNATTRCRS